MIDPRDPSIKKTSGHSIEVETNIVDATLSPNRTDPRSDPCNTLLKQYRLQEAVIGIDIGGVLVSHKKNWDGAQEWHQTSDSMSEPT